ncbi:hypothetical protein [Ralstonia wenshanensis]|uniref:hypothetical protein n=1 Tax=Ralstonia wenshanensis TaxID=2842456 RepID=UPI003D99882B
MGFQLVNPRAVCGLQFFQVDLARWRALFQQIALRGLQFTGVDTVLAQRSAVRIGQLAIQRRELRVIADGVLDWAARSGAIKTGCMRHRGQQGNGKGDGGNAAKWRHWINLWGRDVNVCAIVLGNWAKWCAFFPPFAVASIVGENRNRARTLRRLRTIPA